MGLYAPAQIVGDARKNGVEVREIDVSFSFAQNTLEEGSGKYCAVRLGFRQIDGFHWLDPDEEGLKRIQSSCRGARLGASYDVQSHIRESITTIGRMDSGPAPNGASTMRNCASENDGVDWADRIVAARARRPFTSLEDFARDTALPKRALIL